MRNKCVDNDFNYYRGGCEIPTWQVKPLTTSTFLPYLVSLKFGGKAQNTFKFIILINSFMQILVHTRFKMYFFHGRGMGR